MNNETIPVSVIIPNYNSGFFLKECIESINSGLWPTEILVIDDCSTDDSLYLAYKLQLQYKNIRILQSASNVGAAAARKLGIFAASQDLIALIDADDVLETNALAVAYAAMTTFGADACIFDLWSFNAKKKWRHDANPDSLPTTGRAAVLLTLGGWRMHAAGIFLKTLYKKAYQDFTEITFNADELLTRLVFSHAIMVVGCDKKYFYRSHSASTTRTLNVRRLSSLRSQFWLLDFARDYPEAPIRSMVLGSIGEAWFYWKNRKKIGSAETLSELRFFVHKIARFPRLWFWLWISPKYFLALIFLYVVLWDGTQVSNKLNGVDHG